MTLSSGTLLGTGGTNFGASSGTVTVNNGALLQFGATGLYGAASVTTVPTLSIQGGVITNTSGYNNPLNNVVLNGGTLTSAAGNSTWGAWDINGTVTSSGASSIGGAVLMNLNYAGGTTTFNVTGGTLAVPIAITNGD